MSKSADFDGDFRPDLAIGWKDGLFYRIQVLFSSGRQSTSVTCVATSDQISHLVSDVDRDHIPDLVVTASTAPARVWLNDGRGHFDETRSLPAWSSRSPLAFLISLTFEADELQIDLPDETSEERPVVAKMGVVSTSPGPGEARSPLAAASVSLPEPRIDCLKDRSPPAVILVSGSPLTT